MEYIYIGEYVNTHGVKGEIRILPQVPYSKKVLKKGNTIYLGTEKIAFQITQYRPHKNYDMVTLEGITNIDQVLPYKGMSVWMKKEEVTMDEYFYEDLIGMEVFFQDQVIGSVVEIMKNSLYDIFVVKGEKTKTLIPYIEHFIQKIDPSSHQIRVVEIEGLITHVD